MNDNIVLVIPSLNPNEKFAAVVRGFLEQGFPYIVLVNDGSDEEHVHFFDEFRNRGEELTVLDHEVNKGKGRAMKTAFAYCIEHFPGKNVITVDGDGQHLPEDVTKVAQAFTDHPNDLILGVRDFSAGDVPFRSKMGNNLTKAIFRVLCRIRISDTQTGLRGYPAALLPTMLTIRGERYEYETEMLMSLRHDHKISFTEVPIQTVYEDNNSVSHFHPIRDSWRIYKLIFAFLFKRLFRLLKFSASSLIAAGIDWIIFTLVNLFFANSLPDGTRYLAAVVSGKLISSLVNFTLNRKVVFRSDQPVKKVLLRYYCLWAVQTALSYGLIWLITSLLHTEGLQDSIVKPIVDIILFFASYKIQKNLIFKSDK